MNLESKSKNRKERGQLGRRDFLAGLGKWSAVVIAAAAGGAMIGGVRDSDAARSRWVNRRVGGGAWANRSVGGGAWANRGAAWANRGAAWANRAVGGGGAWVNRRVGGGAWANRR